MKPGHGFLAVRRTRRLVTALLQSQTDNFAYIRVVVDHQYHCLDLPHSKCGSDHLIVQKSGFRKA